MATCGGRDQIRQGAACRMSSVGGAEGRESTPWYKRDPLTSCARFQLSKCSRTASRPNLGDCASLMPRCSLAHTVQQVRPEEKIWYILSSSFRLLGSSDTPYICSPGYTCAHLACPIHPLSLHFLHLFHALQKTEIEMTPGLNNLDNCSTNKQDEIEKSKRVPKPREGV